MTENTRTCGLRILAHAGEPVFMLFERETVRTYEDGNSLRTLWREGKRNLESIAETVLPGGPVTVSTIGELQALILACADAFDGQDNVAAAERLAAKEKEEVAAKEQELAMAKIAATSPTVGEGSP